MKPIGAVILAGALFLPWYTLEPAAPGVDFGLQTMWEQSILLASVLTVLAVLAVRFRAAGAVAAVIIVAAIVFAPESDIHRDAAPYIALLGALTAALDDARWVARLGAIAVLGSLLVPWYEDGVFIITRGANDTEATALLGGSGADGHPPTLTIVVTAALAVLSLVRPRLAWLLVAFVVFSLIEPHHLPVYGAWIALTGSILAWAGGLEASRAPNITDQCSPATRSSTSPASPASS